MARFVRSHLLGSTLSKKIAFVSSRGTDAEEAMASLAKRYASVEPAEADVIVALGGDGFMLEAIHRNMAYGVPIYGMNRGTVGFLLNDFGEENLQERLEKAEEEKLRPLHMRVTTDSGIQQDAYGFNEVSLLRQTRQAANLRVSIDGKVRIDRLMCDGCLVATPASLITKARSGAAAAAAVVVVVVAGYGWRLTRRRRRCDCCWAVWRRKRVWTASWRPSTLSPCPGISRR